MCLIERSTQDESLVLPWLVEHAGCIQSRSQKGRDGKVPSERQHGKKPTQEFVSFGEKVLAKQISTDSDTSLGFGMKCETTVQNVS